MTTMDYFFYPFLFGVGLCFGSFFNVVALRVPLKHSIVVQPFSCPHCGRRLHGVDLLPVLGFFIRGGRCAGCLAPIALYYPIMELVTGCLFLISYMTYKDEPLACLAAFLLSSLAVIVTLSDLVYTRIPNRVLLVFLPLFILVRLAGPQELWSTYLLGGFFGFISLFVIEWIKPDAIGMGDVKLLAVLGVCIGFQSVLLTLFLASLIGVMTAIFMMLAGIVKWKGTIPFGPSLCAGAILSQFAGESIVRAYLAILSHL